MEMAFLSTTDHQAEAGRRLRAAIDALGIKYVEAAALMGISKNMLNNWMAGSAPVRAYELYRLCRATGVTADWVLLNDPSGLPQRIAQRLRTAEAAPQPAD